MEEIKIGNKLCMICMEEHEVNIIEMTDIEIFKDEEVTFKATYQYCSITDGLLETEEMIRANNLAMKDSYREKMNLLTSNDIIRIREKYGLSQKELSKKLNWEQEVITRYENHQVQDREDDNILRRIESDTKCFLE